MGTDVEDEAPTKKEKCDWLSKYGRHPKGPDGNGFFETEASVN